MRKSRQESEATRIPRIEAARSFVATVNAATPCARCGGGPIEWHNPTHVLGRKSYRIGYAVAHGRRVEEIAAEMDASTPLCRRCHMAEDGRLARFASEARTRDKTKPARSCVRCGLLYKPTRRGLCSRCYDRQRSRQR